MVQHSAKCQCCNHALSCPFPKHYVPDIHPETPGGFQVGGIRRALSGLISVLSGFPDATRSREFRLAETEPFAFFAQALVLSVSFF
jgi:hypothetical protein